MGEKKKITDIAREMRMLRLNNNELLYDMANKLSISSSYLSSIENGKRTLSKKLLNKIQDVYHLSDTETKKLEIAASKTQPKITIDVEDVSISKKELAFTFAKKFAEMDENTVRDIQKAINKRRR